MPAQTRPFKKHEQIIHVRHLIIARGKRIEEALQELKEKPVLKNGDVEIFRSKINALFKKSLLENKQKKETIVKLEEKVTKTFSAEFPGLLNISFNLKESRIIAFNKQITGSYKLTYKGKVYIFAI